MRRGDNLLIKFSAGNVVGEGGPGPLNRDFTSEFTYAICWSTDELEEEGETKDHKFSVLLKNSLRSKLVGEQQQLRS